jgi:hypothetical protein
MALRTFYRLALILPLFGLGVAARLSASGYGPRYYVVGTVAWEYPAAFVQTLLVYCLLAAWVWVQLGRRPASRLTPVVWRSPLLFVVLALMVDLAVAAASHARLEVAQLGGILLMTALVVGIAGFAYVVLLMVLRASLRLDQHALGESARAGA